MARNRAKFYIDRLAQRGWSKEAVCKFCNINAVRYEFLSMPMAIPRSLEVRRLRSMMKKQTDLQRAQMKDIWTERKHQVSDFDKKELRKNINFTMRQVETVGFLAQSTQKGHATTVLDRVDAVIASKLTKRGFTYIEEAQAGKSKFKRYGLTRKGVVAAESLGLRAVVVSAAVPSGWEVVPSPSSEEASAPSSVEASAAPLVAPSSEEPSTDPVQAASAP